MAFYTNFATDFFHTVFARRSVLKGTFFKRDQKVIFVKSPISSPIVMPLGLTFELWSVGVCPQIVRLLSLDACMLSYELWTVLSCTGLSPTGDWTVLGCSCWRFGSCLMSSSWICACSFCLSFACEVKFSVRVGWDSARRPLPKIRLLWINLLASVKASLKGYLQTVFFVLKLIENKMF